MMAFRNIGQTGSTSLDVVAPGISEALITTAIGLAVAIPAVIGFNYLQGKIKALVGEIEDFSFDFLNILQKMLAAERQ
jgi:biopolymer transport protein TolQ